MSISLLMVSIGLLCAGGVGALLCWQRPRWASGVGAGTAVLGCAVGLVSAIQGLLSATPGVLRRPWAVPFGEFAIAVDGLSAFFLVAVFLLCGLAALYGAEYLRAYEQRKSLGPPWFFFNLLVVGMVLVITARNAVLFLVAWELMSLASFFLVTFEHEEEGVGQAGWTYLVATHLGTAFLLAMFVLLGGGTGGLDFAGFAGGHFAPGRASLIFVLAVIGFGTKAGFMPFHVWLPEAHPAAPSHVSAVMSGVMIKTGIYGLVRTVTFLGLPPAWWGWLLIGIGLVSGVLGVLFALAQHDLKRLLAYHSVENIGIIALGLGTGMLGLSLHSTPMAVLGFGGGLLHVLNHACFKGLLFLGAGAVLHGAGSREIDRLGGLLKRMPWTGWAFLVGAAAISGLPPLNGFVSELLVYLGALEGVRAAPAAHLAVLVGVVAGLALIGGLAMACFAKAFGVVFLGEPRSQQAAHAHECGWMMRVPMVALAVACAVIGLLGPLMIMAVVPAIALAAGLPTESVRTAIIGPRGVLAAVVGVSVVWVALVAGLMLLRRRLLADRAVSQAVTWDCGYARPTVRMQYTASSFAQPLTSFFQLFLRTRTVLAPPAGYFPASASLATHTDDVCREKMYGPVFRSVAWLLSQLRWLQHGRVQIYVLYIALTLLALLLWKLEQAMSIAGLIQPLLALALAPLLLGVINRVKALAAGRTGPSLFQLYRDLAKLLGKGAVYSQTTTAVFRLAPVIGLAAVVMTLTLLPMGNVPALLPFPGDFVLLAYLLGLMRFLTVIGALDTGSSFEGMGASREVQFSALAEPVLMLAMATLARGTGSISLSEIYAAVTVGSWIHAGPALGMTAAALLAVVLVENARIPVDDPNTHLELTMIHEVMVLDYSGPEFAMILYAASLKLWVLGALLVGLCMPVRTGWFVPDVCAFVLGMFVLAVVIGVIESNMARLRLVRVPQMLVGAGAIAIVALVLVAR